MRLLRVHMCSILLLILAECALGRGFIAGINAKGCYKPNPFPIKYYVEKLEEIPHESALGKATGFADGETDKCSMRCRTFTRNLFPNTGIGKWGCRIRGDKLKEFPAVFVAAVHRLPRGKIQKLYLSQSPNEANLLE